jgi:putative transposase
MGFCTDMVCRALLIQCERWQSLWAAKEDTARHVRIEAEGLEMRFDPDRHHRRSIRLQHYDYTLPGAYYVTVCAVQKQLLFGEIKTAEMHLNRAGQIVLEEWLRTPELRPNVELDAFVIMPNHIHVIFLIMDLVRTRRAISSQPAVSSHSPPSISTSNPISSTRASPDFDVPLRKFGSGIANSVHSIMGSFKSSATRQVNRAMGTEGSIWHTGMWEHVIRSQIDLDRIREYIALNPSRWEDDEHYPRL